MPRAGTTGASGASQALRPDSPARSFVALLAIPTAVGAPSALASYDPPMTLNIGDIAPDFTLPDQHGEPVRLSSMPGQSVVLYFYPKADTPGCTTQACGIRDRRSEYEQANAVVLGVSPDPVPALSKFADKYGLPFTLLSDEDHRVAEQYGVWVEKNMYGRKYMGNERTTFLVGPDGRITHVFHKVKPAEHDEKVLAALGA